MIIYKINSGHLKPKTEFRFNYKQYRNFIFFEFERSNFSNTGTPLIGRFLGPRKIHLNKNPSF